MSKSKVADAATKRVEKELRERYLPTHPGAAISVYRFNSASIRVRIIDADFVGKSIVEREADILPIIHDLPDRTQDQITVLLLLTPRESARSMFSAEFDNPAPSRL